MSVAFAAAFCATILALISPYDQHGASYIHNCYIPAAAPCSTSSWCDLFGSGSSSCIFSFPGFSPAKQGMYRSKKLNKV